MKQLETKLGKESYKKLTALGNSHLLEFIARYVELCNPDEVFVSTDSEEDISYIREEAIRNGEEAKLTLDGHTIHFDGYFDQARDKKNTKFLVPSGVKMGAHINAVDREEGLEEIHTILKDIMRGHKLYIRFFCLGPTGSIFSIPCVQLTDSSYVAHSEDLLYRAGYEEFKRLGSNSKRFFRFVHSEGALRDNVSKDIEKRRVYIDAQDNIVYSTNTQYGGNTIGLKKLAMRLAIGLASEEGWLTEHMFILGIHSADEKPTYFAGAYPSLCGKTSTAMLEGESIVGDDIAYFRNVDGRLRAVNVEKGMFGIIQGVNPDDDSIIWKTLHSPGEIIFSNVLVTEDKDVHWIGKPGDMPPKGINHSGQWSPGKKDADGEIISPSHKNARFTLKLALLENVDPHFNDPDGVKIEGIIYGGRDSDTGFPVEESFDWVHGIITKGASLESETTAATLGKEGVKTFNPMSNIDFVSVPLSRYIKNNLDFGGKLKESPVIFSVNYFLKDSEGNFLNDREDKRVWLKWMNLRVKRQVSAIKTPGGYIPEYEDINELFKTVLGKDYTAEDYNRQFTLRVKENLSKIDRIVKIYESKVSNTPEILFRVLREQAHRLKEAQEKFGDYISPEKF